MCQKVHQKLVPASDQGAFLMMFDNFFIQIKLSKTSFTYFFLLRILFRYFRKKKILECTFKEVLDEILTLKKMT